MYHKKNKEEISVVINTYNEEDNIIKCIQSIKFISNEIIVIDNYSNDRTIELAKKEGAKVFLYPHSGIVESSRNFGIKKARKKWIFLIDADERAPLTLLKRLEFIAKNNSIDVVLIPRKNIIFGKWIKYTGWWPDHQLRFFKKGSVYWSGDINLVQINSKRRLFLPPKEKYALIHYNYKNFQEFIERLNRYTDFYARRLIREKFKISLCSPIIRSVNEFVNRFIICKGYKDGYLGLVLSISMSFYFFCAYIKALELQKKIYNRNNILRFSQKVILLGCIQLIFWLFLGIYILESIRFVRNRFKQVCLRLKIS